MSKPIRARDLLNPFVQQPAPSLAMVIKGIATSSLSASRKRDCISAIRRYADITGQDLAHASADLAQIRMTLDGLSPAALRLSAKTWSNLRSNLLAAIQASGAAAVLQTVKVPLTPAWLELLEQMPDRRSREGLSRFMRFCSLNETDPTQVDRGVLQAFGHALRMSTLARNATTLERDVATLWNRLVGRLGETSLTAIDLPSRRALPTRVSLEHLPETFNPDLRAHLEWASGKDPFAEDARARPLASSSIRLRESYVQTAVTALVRAGVPPENIHSLADLVSPEAFKAILRQRHKQGEEASTSYNEGLGKALVAIAREWIRPDEKVMAELNRLRSKLPSTRPGLTDKNNALLRHFDDPEMLDRLVSLPGERWRQIERQPPSLRTLADAQAALAIAILTFAPLRIANLVGLSFGETIKLPERDDQETVIQIAAPQMKNREPYLIELPPHLTLMLRRYQTRVLTPLLKRCPTSSSTMAVAGPSGQSAYRGSSSGR